VVFKTSFESKGMLISRLKSTVDEPPYVIQCNDGLAVLRCAPKERESIVEAMGKADPKSESLLTSGTLRTLRERYPALKVKRPR